MASTATVKVAVIAEGAEEMERIAKAIADHYLAIADLHGEMASLRKQHDKTVVQMGT